MSGDAADLEQTLDELFGADLNDFVRERTRLSRQLRDAGDPGGAEQVKSLRKPSVAAWVLNQLARRNRRDLDLLLDAGHRLREAQVGVLSGAEKDVFERARTTETETLRRLTHAAEALLQERGTVSGSVLSQISESLGAAAISPSGRELLARGRFLQPMQAGGFEIVSELAATAPTRARPKPRTTADSTQRHAANEALKDAKNRLREAQRQARQANQNAHRLQTQAAQAAEEANHADGAVEDAARQLREAQTRFDRNKRR